MDFAALEKEQLEERVRLIPPANPKRGMRL